MTLYLVVKQYLSHADIGRYTSYGIMAVQPHCSEWKHVAFVSDVSTSWSKVAVLAMRCTFGQLDPIHLLDVVEDFLCG